MRRSTPLCWIAWAAVVATWHGSAPAASHQWRFNEIFSNADGTVQFIEMKECCGFTAETQLDGKWILAVGADHQFTFTKNLTGNTANRYLLLATEGFAALPGAPAPDFILPDNFISLANDTLEYWLYSAAIWNYRGLPQDGRTSLSGDGLTWINSPTNYAGETGSVDAAVPVTQASWGTLKRVWNILPLVP